MNSNDENERKLKVLTVPTLKYKNAHHMPDQIDVKTHFDIGQIIKLNYGYGQKKIYCEFQIMEIYYTMLCGANMNMLRLKPMDKEFLELYTTDKNGCISCSEADVLRTMENKLISGQIRRIK